MTNWPRCRSCNRPISLLEGRHCLECRNVRRLRIIVALLTLGFLIICARARGGVVTEEFLDRVAWTESRNNPNARGRHGELGAWQLKAIAVAECNRVYGWRLSHRDVTTAVVGRAAAQGYCLILENTLRARLGRQPTSSELYRAFRCGPDGFMRSIAASAFCTPRTNSARAGRSGISQLTEREAVAGSIPERAISREGREGNGKCLPTTKGPVIGQRNVNASRNREESRARAKGVTAGETAPVVNILRTADGLPVSRLNVAGHAPSASLPTKVAPRGGQRGDSLSPTTPRTGASATDGRVGIR